MTNLILPKGHRVWNSGKEKYSIKNWYLLDRQQKKYQTWWNARWTKVKFWNNMTNKNAIKFRKQFLETVRLRNPIFLLFYDILLNFVHFCKRNFMEFRKTQRRKTKFRFAKFNLDSLVTDGTSTSSSSLSSSNMTSSLNKVYAFYFLTEQRLSQC